MNLGFTGDYGVYHSAYDDHFWMTSIGDPTFEYHTALTRIWGLVALRLANSDLLPFDFAANGAALQGFLSELQAANRIDPTRLPLERLKMRIADFEAAGEHLRAVTLADLATGSSTPRHLKHLNAQLFQVESNWLDPKGIPGRPWFQHLLYAARYTYAHLEFPGLTEAVEASDWRRATQQAQALDDALLRNTRLLQAATADWASAGRVSPR
jgi:N-acetylated-alpha-linked acidic dipeptidase